MADKKKETEKEETIASPPAISTETKGKKEKEKEQTKRGFAFGKLKMIAFLLIVAITSWLVITKVISPKLLAQRKNLEKKRTELKEKPPKERPQGDIIGQIYPIENIIVNPAGSNGSRFVKVSIGLEMGKVKLDQELKKRDVQLRDILIDVFTSKTIEEVINPAEREDLREEIKGKINSLLVSGKIRNVYFADLVIQ
jgi:flagellar FliL protein